MPVPPRRLALRQYLNGIEDHLTSENNAARLAAEGVFDEVNVEEYKQAATDRNEQEIKQALEVSGRMKEFRASYS